MRIIANIIADAAFAYRAPPRPRRPVLEALCLLACGWKGPSAPDAARWATATTGAPLLLGFILGPMMEENLRRAMLLSRGDWSVFVTRPLSASLLAVAALLLVIVLLPAVKNKRKEAFVED